MKTLFVVCILGLGMVTFGLRFASGQDFPNKPIRMVTSGTGGGNDFAARLIVPGLSSALGQQVIVDNRASVTVAAEIVAGARPDGYTLLLSGSPLWIGPLIQKLSYDPVKDFSPIVLLVSTPNVLVVHPSLPVKSVKDLIALAKAKPGQLNYGAGSTGSTQHLAAELFKAMAGLNIVRINYKGAGGSLTALIGGEVQLMFPSGGSVAEHVKARRLIALAVTTAAPSALFPGLPTVAASGLPGYESTSPFGIFGPAKTPVALVSRLNQAVVRVLSMADVKERFLNAGVETIGGSAAQLAATVKSEMAILGKVIKDADIRAE